MANLVADHSMHCFTSSPSVESLIGTDSSAKEPIVDVLELSLRFGKNLKELSVPKIEELDFESLLLKRLVLQVDTLISNQTMETEEKFIEAKKVVQSFLDSKRGFESQKVEGCPSAKVIESKEESKDDAPKNAVQVREKIIPVDKPKINQRE